VWIGVIVLKLPVHPGKCYQTRIHIGKRAEIDAPIPVVLDGPTSFQPCSSDRMGWAYEKLYQPAGNSLINEKAATAPLKYAKNISLSWI
jgi:hypothetical protein